jgi:hypothetical protein
MMTHDFPQLDPQTMTVTRDALHAYARILGDWTSACRQQRKHWWHASLRPSLNGLTTGVVHAGIDFELELNLRQGMLLGHTSTDQHLTESLQRKSPAELATRVREFLLAAGIDERFSPERSQESTNEFVGYATEHADTLNRALNSVSSAMESFRASIREETSPIQLWPHHFDLAMLWLPGDKVPGQDPENEEYSDQQINFGFTFGDAGIPEPYFYVTAYPLPEDFSSLQLPVGTTWHTEGFTGAVLLYQSLIENSDPHEYLPNLWNGLLNAGREHMPALAA